MSVTAARVTAARELRRPPVAFAAVAVAALPALYRIDPTTTHVPLCPLHAATGLWCPLCGATRAVHALLHADLPAALHDNALLVVSAPLLALLWWRWLCACRAATPGPRGPSGQSGLRGPDDEVRTSRPLPRSLVWGFVAVAVAFALARNLPAGSWLAPLTATS